MRKIFSIVSFFVCFVCFKSYSQDLIVTNVGDSIACKIIEQTKHYIHFSYSNNNYSVVKKLRSSHVRNFVLGYYAKPNSLTKKQTDASKSTYQNKSTDKIADTSITITADDGIKPKLSKWQFGINGGYAYRLFKPRIKSTSYELKYIDELKSGYSYGAELYYFHWKKVGFGLKYDVYKSKAERDIRTKDNITIQFLGPSVVHRKVFPNQKTSILSAFWLGYQPYRNVARYIGQDYVLKGRTMGWGVSVAIDHKITEKLALNFGASCFMGSIYKYKKEIKGRTEMVDLSKDNFEDLSRAEFTIGLKFLK